MSDPQDDADMQKSAMQEKLDRIHIVLVEPQEAANVGGVCRAMKTMGIHRLTIVGRSKDYFDAERVHTLAIHARGIFDKAEYADTLEEALSDSVLSAGVTRRRGKFRKYFSYTPEQFADKAGGIADGAVAFVFGRESSGLSDEELQLCSTAVHIPSSPDFPSLNLSHAVQICTYACYRSFGESIAGFTPVSRERINEIVETAITSLDSFDFFKQRERIEVERFFRDVFTRASLSQTESRKMEKIFRKIAAIVLHRPPSDKKQ